MLGGRRGRRKSDGRFRRADVAFRDIKLQRPHQQARWRNKVLIFQLLNDAE